MSWAAHQSHAMSDDYRSCLRCNTVSREFSITFPYPYRPMTDHAPEPQAVRSAEIYVANNGWGERHGPPTMRGLLAALAAEVARREQAERLNATYHSLLSDVWSIVDPEGPSSDLVNHVGMVLLDCTNPACDEIARWSARAEQAERERDEALGKLARQTLVVAQRQASWHDMRGRLSTAEARLAALQSALDESVKLQSHYAVLLNTHDGGQRIIFQSAQAWLDRLAALRTQVPT